jgi:hypothetical protein
MSSFRTGLWSRASRWVRAASGSTAPKRQASARHGGLSYLVPALPDRGVRLSDGHGRALTIPKAWARLNDRLLEALAKAALEPGEPQEAGAGNRHDDPDLQLCRAIFSGVTCDLSGLLPGILLLIILLVDFNESSRRLSRLPITRWRPGCCLGAARAQRAAADHPVCGADRLDCHPHAAQSQI